MVQTASKSQVQAVPAHRASIEPLRVLVGTDMEAVNREIIARMQSDVSLIPELASHLIAAGGKRIRPLLTLGAAKLCGYAGDKHVLLAACVEFIHTATLLHDDVVDESDRRRGNATANVLWGNQPSVLVGDFLFSRAFQLMVNTGSLEVLRILANASAVIAEGVGGGSAAALGAYVGAFGGAGFGCMVGSVIALSRNGALAYAGAYAVGSSIAFRRPT